jgi:hypothetical protein
MRLANAFCRFAELARDRTASAAPASPIATGPTVEILTLRLV